MLDAARVKRNGAIRLAKHARGALDRVGWHARQLGRFARIPRTHGFGHLLESRRMRLYEVAIFQSVAQDHVQHSHKECNVSARSNGQV